MNLIAYICFIIGSLIIFILIDILKKENEKKEPIEEIVNWSPMLF